MMVQLTLDLEPERVRDCLAEMRAFARGGLGGRARLRAVLPTLFSHFEIPPAMHADLLHQCALSPFYDIVGQRTSFYLNRHDAKKEDAPSSCM